MSPLLNAKVSLAAIFAAAAAVIVSALPMPPPGPGQCVVNLTNSPYPQMPLRASCNTQSPILAMLNNGAYLTMIILPPNNGQQEDGCGDTYTMVQYADPSTGTVFDGYVDTMYMDCSTPNEPELSLSRRGEGEADEISCLSWSVAHGGPTNACAGSGKLFSANEGVTCAADGSNCVAYCCENNIEQSCATWGGTHGGPTHACAVTGRPFTTSDRAMCRADDSNCFDLCCGTD